MAETRWLTMNDLHIPAHDKRAVDLVLQVIDKWKPHEIDLAGDIDDMSCLSRFNAGTADEVLGALSTYADLTKQFLADLRNKRKTAEIHYHLGNHEIRLEDYISKKAPALIDTLTYDSLWDLNKNKILTHPYNEPPVHRHGDLFVHHGMHAVKDSGNSVRKAMDDFNISLLQGHCFDDTTEILTPQGWRSYEGLTTDDYVMTMNPDGSVENPELEWNKIDEVHVYDHDGEMVRVRNMAGLDLLVTGGHGIMIPNSNTKETGWKRESADESFGNSFRKFPLAGFHDEEELDLTDDQIRLIAWVIAEGSFNSWKSEEKKYLRIAQSDYDNHLEDLESCLDGCGLDYSKVKRYSAGETEHGTHRNYDSYRYGIKCAGYQDWLFKYIDGDKTANRNLMGMSSRQAGVFLDTYVTADGNINKSSKNSRQIATNRIDHADFIQELAARSGHRSTVISAPYKNGDKTMYYITINSRRHTSVSENNWSREHYEGKVWCVSVSNGTLLVRRNGKTAITANTHRMASINKSYQIGDFDAEGNVVAKELRGFENGHLADVHHSAMKYDWKHDWQQGFAVAHIDDHDWPHVQLVRISPDYVCYVDGKRFEG